MNNFCRHLRESLSERYNIEVDAFVSKKKKLVHMSLVKPLLTYNFFEEMIVFIRNYW